MLTVAALNALGQTYRNDWSEFDGRSARAEMASLGALIEREHAGEDVAAEVLAWCQAHAPDEIPETLMEGPVASRLRALKQLARGASSEQDPSEPIERYLWVYERDGYSNWHTTAEPRPEADLRDWSVRGWDLDSGAEVLAP